MNEWKKPVHGSEEEAKDQYFAFVNKGGAGSPGAVKHHGEN